MPELVRTLETISDLIWDAYLADMSEVNAERYTAIRVAIAMARDN